MSVNKYQKLIKVQSELKVPKNQYNAFGKYSYRSAEDILEEAKPVLNKHNCLVTLDDELVNLGDRYYVHATATFIDVETGEPIMTSAYAREEESKKGMDGSQITGSASSYARKYALNGLFCIDDVKDADTTNTHGKNGNGKPLNQKPVQPKPKQQPKQQQSAGKCTSCDVDIKPAVKAYSEKNHGKPLCRDCQQLEKGVG